MDIDELLKSEQVASLLGACSACSQPPDDLCILRLSDAAMHHPARGAAPGVAGPHGETDTAGAHSSHRLRAPAW